jgi:hypothetical protein
LYNKDSNEVYNNADELSKVRGRTKWRQLVREMRSKLFTKEIECKVKRGKLAEWASITLSRTFLGKKKKEIKFPNDKGNVQS